MTTSSLALLGGSPVRPAGPPGWPLNDPAVITNANKALTSRAWGRYLSDFGTSLCEKLANLHDAQHVRLCASGTAAVELALRGLGVGPGDEVLMAAYDFPANLKDILAVGALPVLVDIRGDDAQIDVDLINKSASTNTKAILVSHLHGGVVDMPRLRELADESGWKILEDACQMPGAIIHGRRAGMWGDAGAISFGGSKLLTAGRGGCVITNNDDVAQRIRLFVERGNDLSPLSEIQAALLVPQLDTLDDRRSRRMASAQFLRKILAELPGLRPFPPPRSDTEAITEPDFYKFALWYDPAAFQGLKRATFAKAVRAEGVALWPAFEGLHRIHSKRRFRSAGSLDQATTAGEQLLVLHHPVLLGSQDDLNEVATAIKKVIEHARQLHDFDTTRTSEYDEAEG